MNRDSLQSPFDVAVVIQTVLRPTLPQAVRSVFAQEAVGRVQILIGVDKVMGDLALIDQIRAECPDDCAITVIDVGYSTSQRHGGVYSNHYGGSLRAALSYLANSRLVAYLDDDNWWAPNHLSSMLGAIQGRSWAFSRRVLFDRRLEEVICRDDWESVGPGKGVHADYFGGYVDTNCLMVDKLACHDALPAWCQSRFAEGVGEDRMIFDRLKHLPFGETGLYTAYYRTGLDASHPYLLWKYKQAGVDLARYLSPERLPPDSVWEECARHDRLAEERKRSQAAQPVQPVPAKSRQVDARYSYSYTFTKPPYG